MSGDIISMTQDILPMSGAVFFLVNLSLLCSMTDDIWSLLVDIACMSIVSLLFLIHFRSIAW